MKKNILLVALCLSLTMAAACIGPQNSKPVSQKEEEGQKPGSVATFEPTPIPQDKAGEADQKADQNPLDSLADGKIEGMEFGIGSKCQDMLAKLGDPQDKGTTDGGFFYVYDTVTYFTDSINENEGSISSVAVRDSRDICGVKIGMKPSEIEKVLGKPYEQNGGNGQDWVVTYEVKEGLYLTFFSNDKDSPTIAALLKRE